MNHLPVVGVPLALVLFAYALWKADQSVRRVALWLMVFVAAAVIPTYLSGEATEELVEHLPNFPKDLFEEHEEFAPFALLSTLSLGVLALGALWNRMKPYLRWIHIALIIVGVLSVITLAYTANLGGWIEHSDILSS